MDRETRGLLIALLVMLVVIMIGAGGERFFDLREDQIVFEQIEACIAYGADPQDCAEVFAT